jgi:hypothetical protein
MLNGGHERKGRRGGFVWSTHLVKLMAGRGIPRRAPCKLCQWLLSSANTPFKPVSSLLAPPSLSFVWLMGPNARPLLLLHSPHETMANTMIQIWAYRIPFPTSCSNYRNIIIFSSSFGPSTVLHYLRRVVPSIVVYVV